MENDFSQFKYQNKLSKGSKLKRLLWGLVWMIAFRSTPGWCLNGWRLSLLRWFGAKHGIGCRVASSAKIWAPWNLELGDYVCIAEGVDCYAVSKIRIGSKVAISQRAFLCSASHSTRTLQRELIHMPIDIGDHAWVCAEAFIGPGVSVGEGSVVGARAVVVKDVDSWAIVAGNPAKFLKPRILSESNGTD